MKARAGCALAAAVLMLACRSQGDPAPASAGPAADQIQFVDRAAEAGLSFTHANGMTGAFLEAEIYAPGVALFDFDNDGDLDLYVVQGAMSAATAETRDRLFRNDLAVAADGSRTMRFVDITEASTIDLRSYGMGVAAGDYDNDGWVDLYTTRLDANVLLHNNGNGTFTDVTRAAEVADAASWSISAAFVDFDRDGWLDLYVTNYLEYSPGADVSCFSRAGAPDYCDPSAYRPAHDRVYHNDRNGTFSDVTRRALPGGSHGAALGVSTADFDGDGWIDVYVANDRLENDLWLNQRDGTFRNSALIAGVAVNANGRAEASMGVDAGDFDNDGDEDLFIANFTSEGHTLYRNLGNGSFEDAGLASGIRPASLPFTGFGAAWIDADNDGWLDLCVVDGAVLVIESLSKAGDPFPLHQRKQLFRSRGDGTFEDVSTTAGAGLAASDVSRGAAFGDLDNDGDIDVVVGNNNGPLRLLLNESRNANHWIGIRALGGMATPRDLVGAQVAIIEGGRTLRRRARADGSYASANDPRVLAGLGPDPGPPAVEIGWPSGRRERWSNVPLDRWTTLREGTGTPLESAAR